MTELYKKEFGDNFELGFDLGELSMLVDKSWHNDMSPSFYFKKGNDYFVLWVDYKNPAQRETVGGYRYTIQEAKNYGTDTEPEVYAEDGEIIAEFEEVINATITD